VIYRLVFNYLKRCSRPLPPTRISSFFSTQVASCTSSMLYQDTQIGTPRKTRGRGNVSKARFYFHSSEGSSFAARTLHGFVQVQCSVVFLHLIMAARLVMYLDIPSRHFRTYLFPAPQFFDFTSSSCLLGMVYSCSRAALVLGQSR
jgi:hypothetical protein